LLVLGLPALLAETYRRSNVPVSAGPASHTASRAVRAAVWGTLLWVAARSGASGHPALDAAANLGTGTAAVGALVAIARIESKAGLLTPPRAALSLDAAMFAGFLWAIATALPLGFALFPSERVRLDPLAVDYATTSAGVGSLLVLMAASLRLRLLRRLELGVGDRAAGALAISLSAFAVALPASLLDVAPPDRILPVAVWASSLGIAWAATTREPTRVSGVRRGVLALLLLGAPVVLLAGVFVRSMPDRAGAIVLVTAAASIVVGLLARAVARPLGPEQSRWLDAIESASRGALQPEPDAALCAALVALGETISTPDARPAIFRNNPEQMLFVDIAGYLHVEGADAPERLYQLAADEPERTLRQEALLALAVRRPEVRPLIAWFEARRAFSATLIVDEDGPLGFILLPGGKRHSVMTLEEARAVRVLGDRISALLAVSSALARSRERELKATANAERSLAECQRLEQIVLASAGRHQNQAARAARSVRSTAYSPSARLTLDEIARQARRDALALRVPPGVEALGWAAHAHLSSARAEGPFVVIDGSSPSEHEPELWQHPQNSPLVLADGGTLTVLEVSSLPLGIQDALCAALEKRHAVPSASSVAPPGLVILTHAPLRELLARGQLSRALVELAGPDAIDVPPLVDRSDDLRALSLAFLARSSPADAPLGIEPGALRLLGEHDFPGNELELAAILLRAQQISSGKAIRAEDLIASGFTAFAREPEARTPVPVSASRRPSARAPRMR
jgi:hypothetical protein